MRVWKKERQLYRSELLFRTVTRNKGALNKCERKLSNRRKK